MQAKGFLTVALALACVALGVVIDRRVLQPPRATTPTVPAPPTGEAAPASATEATRADESAGTNAPVAGVSKLAALAEIEKAIRAAVTNRSEEKRSELLDEIAEAVDPANIPRALALAELIPYGSLKSEFVRNLLRK